MLWNEKRDRHQTLHGSLNQWITLSVRSNRISLHKDFTGDGLCGWNCYHEYCPFFPGISERNWSDEWLEESAPKEFGGKEYSLYEAKQRQHQMGTAMRAQREKVRLLKKGDADPDEVMVQRAKYQAQLDEYSRFCRKMSLPQERERIYRDQRGWVATNTKKQNARYTPEMIKNADRDAKQHAHYKNIIGESIGNLANFRQMKYNDDEKFELLKKKVDTYSEINKKDWSAEFKQKSKDAYDRFSKENVYLSTHALSRLPRLNKSGYVSIGEADIKQLLDDSPNYKENDTKIAYFSSEKQLAIIKNIETGDIVTIVRTKKPKGDWEDV